MTPRPASHGTATWLPLYAVSIMWAAAFATQFVAARFDYHRHLGTWLFRTSPSANAWLGAGIAAFATAAVGMLLSVRWRWAAIPIAFLVVSATAMRNGPVYAPSRVFVWYAAYRTTQAYAPVFHMAWAILAGASLLLSLASWRLVRATEKTDTSRDSKAGAQTGRDPRAGRRPGALGRTPGRALGHARRGRGE
jgi:hypothetical protein